MSTCIPVGNQSFNYNSTSVIPWAEFEKVLDAGWFSTDIVGAQVVDNNEHSWRIIKAGEDYYDLWYEESIGFDVFNRSYKSQSNCFWSQSQLRANLNGSLFYDNTDKLPTAMKNRIIYKEVSVAWLKYNGSWSDGGINKSIDKVWLLTVTEIGGKTVAPTIDTIYDATVSAFLIGDGDPYDYFTQGIDKRSSTSNSGLARCTYYYMWLATGVWYTDYSYANAFYVYDDGSFEYYDVDEFAGVVPAIRVQ